MPSTQIAPVREILADIQAGKMVILVDEEDRENEGDLILAAEHCTPEAINFMAKHARGLICLTLTESRCRQLDLPLMVRDNRSPHGTAFTLSIEAATGVTTGISAHDRARTVLAAVRRDARPADIVQPGHIFPLMAQNGGVLVRAGHTEAGCDLAGLAGLEPSSVICEIMNDDGTMARLPELLEFGRLHGLKIGTIADLIEFRSHHEALVEAVHQSAIETRHGAFQMHAFADRASGATHLVLVHGQIQARDETLVRVHEPLSVLDFLAPEKRHSFSIDEAQQAIVRAGSGVIVLMHRPEDGTSLLRRLQPGGEPLPAAKWDPRTYGIGAQILRQLGVGRMRLLASPRKMPSMAGFGLEVTGHLASLAAVDAFLAETNKE